MKKEFILEVVMHSGGIRRFREWGYTAGAAYQDLRKFNPDVGSLRKAIEA